MSGPADAATIAASEDNSAALAIARAEAAGVVFRLGPDGRVTLSAPQPPGETVLAELRRHRDGIAAMLAAGGMVPPGDPDHTDNAAERAAMAAHYAAPPDACPWQPGTPDPLRDGLLIAAFARPPSWVDPASPPPPGGWCSCCSRSHRSGGRWWREAAEPKGWRCWRCYPPDHLRADQVVEVRT